MFNLFFLLLSHSIFLALSCPTGWLLSNAGQGKCYLFVNQKQTWLEAEDYCNRLAPDGHLTSITSAFENTDIFAKAQHGCGQYWIGLNDIDHTGNFDWIDGQAFQYNNWDSGQPNTGGDKQCVSLNGQTNGKWVMEFCGISNCFVCESYQSAITTTPPTTSPPSMTDCYDWYHIGGARSDKVYQIRVPGLTDPLNVWCDMTTDGGGWTVFQSLSRRINGALSFYDKTWNEYKYGFNNGLNKNLWLGNEYIHILSTKDSNVTLRIDLWGDRAPNSTNPNIYFWEKQSSFYLDSEANYYTLYASLTVEGNASITENRESGINYNIGSPFSTIDNNHDNRNGTCTEPPFDYGGWWLNGCTATSLNGKYIPSYWQRYGFVWYSNELKINPAQSRMMLRKAIS